MILSLLTRRRTERMGSALRVRLRLRWQDSFSALLQAAMLEPKTLEITRRQIRLARLPQSFQGFRLVQLSDIHHSPFLSEAEILTAAQHANQLQPDLIVLTGDYVSHSPSFIAGCARALGTLRARHGVLAVLGNHDHWTDGPAMARALQEQGIRVLINENLSIARGGDRLQVVGVDDATVGRANLGLALAGTDGREPRILLSHNPRMIREAARAGLDLVLAGHTHGGQINWRLLLGRENERARRWLQRPSRRLIRGHAQFGETQLYVNRGLGTVVLPLRYGCPPEISLLELVSD